MSRRPHGPRSGLTRRLLVAQALLLLAGALTTWLVASFVGPSIFHDHLLEAGSSHDAEQLVHVERAFRDSLLIAMGVALFVSVLTAWLVTAWFTRRVRRSTEAVVDTARDIAAGEYEARIDATGLGSEFDQMGSTINELAGRLADTEATRRRLLSDLGHELRTPLATVEMQLDAVEDGIRPLDESTMAVLRSNTTRLRRLADDIAAVSRAQEQRLDLRLEACDLVDLAARSVAERAGAFDDKGVTVRDGPPRERRVAGGPTADGTGAHRTCCPTPFDTRIPAAPSSCPWAGDGTPPSSRCRTTATASTPRTYPWSTSASSAPIPPADVTRAGRGSD